MQAEPGKSPRRALTLLALLGAACALAGWLARPGAPTSLGDRGSSAPEHASQPSAGLPPPPAAAGATGEPQPAERLQARAETSDAPSVNDAAELAPAHVRKVSGAMRVPFATPATNGATSGIRASQAACAGLLERVQRGDALEPGEQLTWQRVCRAR